MNEKKEERKIPTLSDLLSTSESGAINLCGFDVIVMDTLREKYPEKFNESGAMDYKWFESEIRPNYQIYLRNDVWSLSFNIFNEKGSCAVACLVEAAKRIMTHIRPFRELSLAITRLEEAMMWMEKNDRLASVGIEKESME